MQFYISLLADSTKNYGQSRSESRSFHGFAMRQIFPANSSIVIFVRARLQAVFFSRQKERLLV
jgi:hypothetical protein